MALNIKDPETDRLARELSATTGESITDALRVAVAERLARVRRLPARSSDLLGRSRRTLDTRLEDEILGYGNDGLPS